MFVRMLLIQTYFVGTNRMKEGKEEKIVRESCLFILANILKKPTKSKYRVVNHDILCKTLEQQCNEQGANYGGVVSIMETKLCEMGFQRDSSNVWRKNDVDMLDLWERYYGLIKTQKMYTFSFFFFFFRRYSLYKKRMGIPEVVCIKENDNSWKEYQIAFDYDHRQILLFNQKSEPVGVRVLQVGDPTNIFEFDINVLWENHFSEVETNQTKWCGLVLNKRWHFRMQDVIERDNFSNFCSEFNSFYVMWKNESKIYYEALDPFKVTLKQGLERIKRKLQSKGKFEYGKNGVILYKCEFDKCQPQIPLNVSKDVLLYKLYEHIKYFPQIRPAWAIEYYSMVPLEHTVKIIRKELNDDFKVDFSGQSVDKSQYNPLLYECDVGKLKKIEDSTLTNTIPDRLKELFHEIIKNGCQSSLFESERVPKVLPQDFGYKEDDPSLLTLNKFPIIRKVKKLYYDDIHKGMGYPLHLYNICALLLYCADDCNSKFSSDQIQFRHHKWPYFDMYLCEAINILCSHERREETDMELYCGLKGVKLKNIKEIKAGFFISHVSTSDDIEIAKDFCKGKGCILHFHPSMRRASGINSCDVLWITPFKHEREILFSRSNIFGNDKNHQENAWNASIENESDDIQTILLTWTKYDQFFDQTLQISRLWNHSFDLNVIYIALKHCYKEGVNAAKELLHQFQEWKRKAKNKQKFEELASKFEQKRCCNNEVNLFCYFLFKKNYLQKVGQPLKAQLYLQSIKVCHFVKKIQKSLPNAIRI
ncbi:hypothetical protein RFI_15643 [Reticulomyxa filosa]|uniref:Uncharacterized protein n=1 Tax=Reticulomyxa filosa TaxID=46433 RepID=X6N6A3_RETFI|nr:hypothetical protein RFI_15643 [Reticulomyxa filosa]|eukprot:ETO21561.1 hypothetical protein RFI_15643 [Reticulomyxa filosa]